MLYKKVHRQFVRQFRKGRKYKFFSVWEVIKEPYIDDNYIKVGSDRNPFYLINITSGRLDHCNEITWVS